MQTIKTATNEFSYEIPQDQKIFKDDEELKVDVDDMSEDEKTYFLISAKVSTNARKVLFLTMNYAEMFYQQLITNFDMQNMPKDDLVYQCVEKSLQLVKDCKFYKIDEKDSYSYDLSPANCQAVYDFYEYAKAFDKAFSSKIRLFKDPNFRRCYYVKPELFGLKYGKTQPFMEHALQAIKASFPKHNFNKGYEAYCNEMEETRNWEEEKRAKDAARSQRKAEARKLREEEEKRWALESENRRKQLEEELEKAKPTFEQRVKDARLVYTLCYQFVDKWDDDKHNIKDARQKKTVEVNLQTMVNRLFNDEKGLGARLLERDKDGNIVLDEEGYVVFKESAITEQNIEKAERMFDNARDWVENIDPDLR